MCSRVGPVHLLCCKLSGTACSDKYEKPPFTESHKGVTSHEKYALVI